MRRTKTNLALTSADIQRFWKYVAKSSGCWTWSGARHGCGYGQLSVRGVPFLAHRISFEIAHGPIPPGLSVLHRCDIKLCVNPEHLFLGDDSVNQVDALSKGKHASQTHPECFQGEGNSQARITAEQVREIRTLFSEGVSQRSIAQQFGFSYSAIRGIVKRSRWKHLG